MQQISINDYKEQLAGLPGLPGVYRYFDKDGNCLYVGKARDLKRRVSSYFQKNDLSPRIAIMVQQIAAFETTVVRSEAEAFLLENNLIKTLNPKYNILFRDDKSYPYLRISADTFPRVSYYRGSVDRKSRFFGPYPNSGAVREAIGVLQKVFRLRVCENNVFKNRSRPCLMGQMDRCSCPCTGEITPEEYKGDVENACRFLKGETDDVMQGLRDRMMAASDKLHYEEAAVIRDRIAALNDVMHQQAVETTGADTDADIIAVAVTQGEACVNLAMVRGGRHLGDHAVYPEISRGTGKELAASDVLEPFVAQHYAGGQVPETVISSDAADPRALQETLTELAGRRIQFVHEPQSVRRRWLEMAQQNAKIALERHMAEAGGESFEGQMLVAQCILNACEKTGTQPSEAVVTFKYAPARPDPTDSVREAVAAVFDDGDTVTDEPVMYFYNPARVTSAWHESQIFVIEVGGHRFFAERSATDGD